VDLAEEVLRPLSRRMSVPRRTGYLLRELLWMHLELRRPPQGRRVARTIRRPAFAEALALTELDAAARDVDRPSVEAWRALAEEAGVRLGVGGPPAPPDDHRGPRRRGRRQRRGGSGRRGGHGGHGGHEERGVAEEPGAFDPPPPP
jgi:hypothetical protein